MPNFVVNIVPTDGLSLVWHLQTQLWLFLQMTSFKMVKKIYQVALEWLISWLNDFLSELTTDVNGLLGLCNHYKRNSLSTCLVIDEEILVVPFIHNKALLSIQTGYIITWSILWKLPLKYYSDVIMGTMGSQITSLMIVYSTIYSGADQGKHQSSASLAFLRGIHRWPVTWKMFPFDDIIMKLTHNSSLRVKKWANVPTQRTTDAESIAMLSWYLKESRLCPCLMMSSNETFSALLALCVGNSPFAGEFPTQRPVTWSFDVFFDLCLNKGLSQQSWGWWIETPSGPLWRHCNGKM